MNSSLMRFISVFLIAFSLTTAVTAQEQSWLWTTSKAQENARHLSLIVTPERSDSAHTQARFHCDIASDFSYRSATVTLKLRDAKGNLVSEGALPLDIIAGANECAITLETADLGLGSYEATFAISHALLLTEPSHTFTLRNVSVADLVTRTEADEKRVAELATALDGMEESSGAYPYLRLKINLIEDVLKSARENADRSAWESLESQLRYVDSGLDAVHSGMVFGSTSGERTTPMPDRSQASLLVQDGAFMAGGQPVFLFGGMLPSINPEDIARLDRYQLNAASIALQPQDNPASPGSTGTDLAALFDAAETHNISVAIQLNPESLISDGMAAAPSLDAQRRTNLTQEDDKAQWNQYLSEIAPRLRDQSMLFGVSLTEDPYFHFEGEAVKAGFLDFIRANYEDRLALNRAWRAHLASLDDIEPWGVGPYSTYQAHRPYQFDWQTYHQRLGNAYFQWSRDTARHFLPGTPLMATMNDMPFRAGEANYGINREELARIMQISTCAGANGFDDPVYVLEHPRQSANYTLLRSFVPDQPVLNLNSTWTIPEQASEAETFRFLHGAIWESVMAGLSGATIPMDSLVFQRPEALEGFATAALDVNRLAPIVLAFQSAPTDVGILFSQSSRVFDDGKPHLKSALNAFEGTSFGGYSVRFITEDQVSSGILDSVKILVIPDTPAVSDDTFAHLSAYVDGGGTVARTGAPIPYNERGNSRDDLIRNTASTVLVRGLNLPTEYLHAIDAASSLGALPQIPRTVTAQGYPVEGVKSRFVTFEGEQYLFVINLRKEPAYCTLTTATRSGRDLINGVDVSFPTSLDPLVPMLIKLAPVELEMTVTAAAATDEKS